ncbi:hypothetical protein HPB47_007649 [Ixodes persulcatus]|uniref:Uncharacterized protein n=1 Tax=Ixodes persulcatus TaxID=34615 RepID=A0AC60P793_IXOPE|nr:hypothetical protein HPB47_007649 [Ixodes persulcatus]
MPQESEALKYNVRSLNERLTQVETQLADEREVVSTQIKLGDTIIDIHTTYSRPTVGPNDADWIDRLVVRGRHTVLAGDFNARHTAWGYPDNNARGKNIKKACVAAHLQLCNNPETPTRLAQSTNQNDTSPDLTWVSPRLRVQWHVQSDPVGSDHLPIVIKLHISTTPRRRTTFTKWDTYRAAMSRQDGVPFAERIQSALKEARTEYQVKEDKPTPDLHLVKLCRTTWRGLCNSFNDKTGYAKVWSAYRGLAGKTKTRNTGSNLALRLNITEEQLAEEAGEHFFPQQPMPPPPEIYDRMPVLQEQPADAPFTLAELIDALSSARAKSAPGPDQVTITALRNLPSGAMKELLDTFNKVWMEGELPAEWKRSTVIPIPKPGKTPHAIANLRPISLTSNLCKVLERMVIARLQWIFETAGALHPMQTGFRPHMSTQDSLLMIYHDLYERRLFKSQPRTLVTIDLRKAFDSVPHSTLVAAAQRRGIQGRPLNFIKTFLQERTYQVSIGNTKGRWRPNNIGVPQGAVLSPLLFNLAMTDLAQALEAVSQVCYTIYADDVTLWTTTGNATDQQRHMQSALDIVTTFTCNTGFELSKDKTMYMVIPAKRRSSSSDMQLCVEGTPITPTDNIKILGVPFNKNRRASTWITQVKKHWKDGLELLRAITSKAWGAQEDLLRHLVRTLLVSKVVYGLNFLRLTRKQEATLVTMNRAAMRIVTGLPRFTRVEQLECVAQMNTIREIAGEMRISQAQRLSRTPQGRIILTKSGRARLIEGPLMPTPPPPWETEAVVVAKPIPRNQGHDAPERRVTQASIHLAEVGGLEGHVEVFYTDAARSENGRTAIAWHSPTRHDTQQQLTETTRSVCSAELRAILMAVRAATQKRTDVTETRIYTDSQEALRELRRTDTCNPTIAEIRAMVRQAKAHQAISVTWLPGHEGIPGNERANGAARAALQARSLSQGPVPSSVQREVPQDDFDLSEVKRAEKTARKARLTALLPPNPHPIPRGFPRWERVALHRLQTRTMMTPVWLARLHHPADPQDIGPDPNCQQCGVPATCSHLVWECAGYAQAREAAIHDLPGTLRPRSFLEWTHPNTTVNAEQKLIYASLIDFLRSCGVGRFI